MESSASPRPARNVGGPIRYAALRFGIQDSSVAGYGGEKQDHDGSENVDAIGDDGADESLGLRPETASICTPKETPSYAHDVSVVRCSKSRLELPTAEGSQEGR